MAGCVARSRAGISRRDRADGLRVYALGRPMLVLQFSLCIVGLSWFGS